MIDPDEALKQAGQLAADADAGRYTVDERQVDGGQVACILAEFLGPELEDVRWVRKDRADALNWARTRMDDYAAKRASGNAPTLGG